MYLYFFATLFLTDSRTRIYAHIHPCSRLAIQISINALHLAPILDFGQIRWCGLGKYRGTLLAQELIGGAKSTPFFHPATITFATALSDCDMFHGG